jgi:hypothetical protein
MPVYTWLVSEISPPLEYLTGEGDRERRLLEVVDRLEVPWLSAMQQEFGEERGWRVCGPATIGLGWLLNRYTGIPFGGGGLAEHIEIRTDIKQGHNIDHVYLLYFTGKDEVIVIDVTGQLFWESYPKLSGAMCVSVSMSGELRKDMREQFGLIPFSEARPEDLTFLDELPDYFELAGRMHDPQILGNKLLRANGTILDVSEFWGERICRPMRTVIRACPDLVSVVPDWPAEKYVQAA